MFNQEGPLHGSKDSGGGGAQAGRPAVKARSQCRGTAARAAGGASWLLNGWGGGGGGGCAQAGRPAVNARRTCLRTAARAAGGGGWVLYGWGGGRGALR